MRLDQVSARFLPDGKVTYAFQEKTRCDFVAEHTLGSPSTTLKVVAKTLSWGEVLEISTQASRQVKAGCLTATKMMSLPKAISGAYNLAGQVGDFCVTPTLGKAASIGLTALKTGTATTGFLAGTFSLIDDPRAGVCKNIKNGLNVVIDLTKIYANVRQLDRLNQGRPLEVFAKQIELVKNVVGLIHHGVSGMARMVSFFTIHPLLILVSGSVHLFTGIASKIFNSEAEEELQYRLWAELKKQ